MLNKSRAREIDRGLGRYAERISHLIWPWRESRLLIVVGVLGGIDYAVTYALLGFSGKTGVYETGRLASWALATGGFPFLLLIDVAAAGILSLAALLARGLYTRYGFKDYGRAAFVFLLVPYIVVVIYAVANNIYLLVR